MTMQEVSHAPETRSGSDNHEVLQAAILGPHDLIGGMLDEAARRRAPGNDPRRARQLADTFMATTCRHLASVDDVLLPLARRHLVGGRKRVSAYLLQSRELERTLHSMKARLYGDVHASRLQCSELWLRIRLLLAEHEAQETALVDGLAEALADEDLGAIADRLRRTELRSPTRPHPYSPHTGLAGRVSHRMWSLFDGFWDSAEGRVIPHQAPAPHPHRNSLMTRYVLGAPAVENGVGPAQTQRRGAA